MEINNILNTNAFVQILGEISAGVFEFDETASSI